MHLPQKSPISILFFLFVCDMMFTSIYFNFFSVTWHFVFSRYRKLHSLMTTLLRVQMLTNTLVQFALTSSIIPTPADPANTHFVDPVFDDWLPQIHKIRSALFVGNISMSVFQIMVRIMISLLYDRPSVAVIRSTELNC